ncbi:hypothetical protein M662_07830 [Bacillus sp. SB49]|uniref:FAD-dependent monooxygenase n=1 Tax=Bacillus sp. SB49 TaxID=1071080 RepID=UPI00041A3C09|nr:FAD-dependent monooxygenase [Bacillus sp. SB49]QHT46404.1 hypothetical protein M662_07830 [Bacillus sp. SB49]
MSQLPITRVLIVGGGIGGLSTAIALGKLGIKTEIVEVKQDWQVYGVGIFQPPNALRALNELNVAKRCLEEGYSFEGMAYCDAEGNRFAEPESPKIAGYPGLNVISRKKLHDLLLEEALSYDTTMRMGTTVESFNHIEQGVSVQLTDGTVQTYDLVIGADGANSRMRDLLFGSIEKSYVGQAVWRYKLPRLEGVETSILYYGEKAKAGLVPMSEQEMYLLLTTSEPGNPRMPEDRLHELLLDRIDGFGGQVAAIKPWITDPDAVVYRPIFDHMLQSPWYEGSVLLIGDAAHCTTPHLGQGAALAVEDAVVLAELIKEHEDVHTIMQAFMNRRYDRSRYLLDHSHQLAEWELMEWAGTLPEHTDVAAYSYETLKKMNEAI